MLKKFSLFILLFLLAVVIWQIDLIKYGFGQAKGQMNVLWNAKSLDEYLSDPSFPDSLKQKIVLAQEIKSFANNELGLAGEENYNKMYDQKGKPVLWVVTASPQFELKPFQWKFPFLGSVSYKGFFEYELAEKEANELKKQDLDVNIGQVSAWSTLGWFKDPLLSNLLLRNEGYLSDVIIHELTHTTVFIKNDVQFNENLATFVGNKGAELFLIEKFGVESPQYKNYIQNREDRSRFANYVLAGAEYMDSVYQNIDSTANYKQKLEIKEAALHRFINKLDTVQFNNKKRYENYFNEYFPDNTFFLSYTRYRANLEELDILFKNNFENNLKAFIEFFKTNPPPFKSIENNISKR